MAGCGPFLDNFGGLVEASAWKESEVRKDTPKLYSIGPNAFFH